MRKYLVTLEVTNKEVWQVKADSKEDAENNYYYGEEIRKDRKFLNEEITSVEEVK